MKIYRIAKARMTVDVFNVNAESESDAINLVQRGKVPEYKMDVSELSDSHLCEEECFVLGENE